MRDGTTAAMVSQHNLNACKDSDAACPSSQLRFPIQLFTPAQPQLLQSDRTAGLRGEKVTSDSSAGTIVLSSDASAWTRRLRRLFEARRERRTRLQTVLTDRWTSIGR